MLHDVMFMQFREISIDMKQHIPKISINRIKQMFLYMLILRTFV